ncbi:MAG: hypothetical protein WBM97_01880, partial [Sedimenticolaceae bacterium]
TQHRPRTPRMEGVALIVGNGEQPGAQTGIAAKPQQAAIGPQQIDVLNVQQVATIRLAMVSSRPDLHVGEALGDGYLMVDWGLAHAVTHRRLFPDAPEPLTRLSTARMAASYLLALGGSAYLPLHLVEPEIAVGRMHPVQGAPAIEYPAYAVYPVRGPRAELIAQILPMTQDVT